MLYYATDKGEIVGPFNANALRQMHLAGLIGGETLVAADGDTEWVALAKVLQSIDAVTAPLAFRERLGNTEQACEVCPHTRAGEDPASQPAGNSNAIANRTSGLLAGTAAVRWLVGGALALGLLGMVAYNSDTAQCKRRADGEDRRLSAMLGHDKYVEICVHTVKKARELGVQ